LEHVEEQIKINWLLEDTIKTQVVKTRLSWQWHHLWCSAEKLEGQAFLF